MHHSPPPRREWAVKTGAQARRDSPRGHACTWSIRGCACVCASSTCTNCKTCASADFNMGDGCELCVLCDSVPFATQRERSKCVSETNNITKPKKTTAGQDISRIGNYPYPNFALVWHVTMAITPCGTHSLDSKATRYPSIVVCVYMGLTKSGTHKTQYRLASWIYGDLSSSLSRQRCVKGAKNRADSPFPTAVTSSCAAAFSCHARLSNWINTNISGVLFPIMMGTIEIRFAFRHVSPGCESHTRTCIQTDILRCMCQTPCLPHTLPQHKYPNNMCDANAQKTQIGVNFSNSAALPRTQTHTRTHGCLKWFWACIMCKIFGIFSCQAHTRVCLS